MDSIFIIIIILVILFIAFVAFMLFKNKLLRAKKESKPIYRGYDISIKDEIEKNPNIGTVAQAVIEKNDEIKDDEKNNLELSENVIEKEPEIKNNVVEEVKPETSNLRANSQSLNNYEIKNENKFFVNKNMLVSESDDTANEIADKKENMIDIPKMENIK